MLTIVYLVWVKVLVLSAVMDIIWQKRRTVQQVNVNSVMTVVSHVQVAPDYAPHAPLHTHCQVQAASDQIE